MFNRYTLGVMLIGLLILCDQFLACEHRDAPETPPLATSADNPRGAWDVVIGPGYVRATSVPVSNVPRAASRP